MTRADSTMARKLDDAIAYIDAAMARIKPAQERAAQRVAERETTRTADTPRPYGQRLSDGFRLMGGER